MPHRARALLVLTGLLLAAPALGRSRPFDRGVENDGLPPDVIKAHILQHMAPIRKCYEDGLKRRPDLSGKVQFGFLILATGAVTDLKNQGSTLNDAGAVVCVAGVIQSWHFPANPKGGVTRATYPFTFAAAE
jgi:hypothetical protein